LNSLTLKRVASAAHAGIPQLITVLRLSAHTVLAGYLYSDALFLAADALVACSSEASFALHGSTGCLKRSIAAAGMMACMRR
jgi:hypothetical protein